jgi:hypothetical protein
MKELAAVLAAEGGSSAERIAAQKVFLKKRGKIWKDIQEGRFPARYISTNRKTFVGAPRRTAIRCDFLLASKAALGPKYTKDRISDLAQRDLLFYVSSRSRGVPERGRSSIAAPGAPRSYTSA